MFTRKTLKINKWEKKIISGVCFTNEEQYGSFMHKNQNRFIFDFGLMRSYFLYGCGVLRMIVHYNGKLMLISDRVNYSKGIKITAIKASFFYGCGCWPGGLLTKIKLHSLVPSFLVSLGLDYPCNFLNEASLLQIPALTYIFNITNKNFFINDYNLPAINREASLLVQLARTFAFFARKYNNVKKYDKYINTSVMHSRIKTGLYTLNNSKFIYNRYTKGVVLFLMPSTKILTTTNKNLIATICNEQLNLLSFYSKRVQTREKHKLMISHKKYIEQNEIHIKNTYIKKKKLNIVHFCSSLINKQSTIWSNRYQL